MSYILDKTVNDDRLHYDHHQLVLSKNSAKAFMTTAPLDSGTVRQHFLIVVVVGLAAQLLYNPSKSYLLVKD